MPTIPSHPAPPTATTARRARLRRTVGTAAVALGAGTLGAVVAPQPADGTPREAGAPAHALSVTMHSEEERVAPAAASTCHLAEPAAGAAPAPAAERGRLRRARTIALRWWAW
ncbi:MAG TPA: hypothetical protein VFS08_16905 [Gemmatimonadaceae bacterium]|nr:hypothetical protein [Gemmatimonadaceae bacterium]